MVDVHCHFDMAENPIKYISENEKRKIVTIGMTNLPSHFQLGKDHVREYKYIRLALGLHPLRANDHKNEYSNFRKYINETSYIGEVGLDFSPDGFRTKEIQIKSFEFVLDCIQGEKKIISLHSRRAEKEVLEMISNRSIETAIFHWYSGSLNVLDKIINCGFFLSVNSAMLKSENGRKIIAKIPKELILTETDYPFIEKADINAVLEYLSRLWAISETEVERITDENFRRLLLRIK
jgi:TatD DNase family protein